MPVCPNCHQTGPELGTACPCGESYLIDESALEAATRDRRIGTVVADRFVVLDQISEGGMGAVYRAIQLPVRREVALKVLRAELERSHKVRKRFIREARAISQLSHPNIITLHDFGFDEYDQPYMVMEYAPGDELSEWAQIEDLTARRLVSVMRQLLSALAEAHDQGIVHRDLKPQNVIVTHTGQHGDFPKLLDFGIARLVNKQTTQGLTADGEVFGTPHYMSPEQARGAGDVGPEADVYAMGIILYECCTGDVPFDADSPLSVLFMHINEPIPEPVPRQGLDLPEGLEEVIYKATEKEADERFANAGAMLAAFDDALGLRTETGSFSLSGQFPSTTSTDGADRSRGGDDEVAASPTVMLTDDQWDVEEAASEQGGSTLRSHQFDDDENVSSDPAPSDEESKSASGPAPQPETRAVEAAESSSPPWGLIAAAFAVAALLVGGTIAVAFIGLDGDDGVDDTEPVAQKTTSETAQDEPDDIDGDEEAAAERAGSNDEATASPRLESEDDTEPTGDDEESESAPQREESKKEEVVQADVSPPEPRGASSDEDVGSSPPAPQPADDAPSSPPPESETSDDASGVEATDEGDEDEEEAEEAFEPGKFERPATEPDDGPTKFQRPDEIGQ